MKIYIIHITAVISIFICFYLTHKTLKENIKKVLSTLLCAFLSPASIVHAVVLITKGNFEDLANLKIWQIGAY